MSDPFSDLTSPFNNGDDERQKFKEELKQTKAVVVAFCKLCSLVVQLFVTFLFVSVTIPFIHMMSLDARANFLFGLKDYCERKRAETEDIGRELKRLRKLDQE